MRRYSRLRRIECAIQSARLSSKALLQASRITVARDNLKKKQEIKEANSQLKEYTTMLQDLEAEVLPPSTAHVNDRSF